MFNAIRANKLQIISTIILAVALAFLVILFVKKANAEGFLENQLKIRIVGKKDYFVQQEDGTLKRYTDVKPGEIVQLYISYLEKMGKQNWVFISNPKEVVWVIDGKRVTLQTYKNRATYQVPFYKSWDTITISATDNTILSGTQKGTLTLVNLEFEEPLAGGGYYDDDYYDYGYYDDIPDYIDTDEIIARYMRPVYINGRLFYQIIGLPDDYEPFTCGQFINTVNGLRYIPCREYIWEWVIAYRGCLRFHHLYGWIWHYDHHIGGSGIDITINIYYTNDWFIYHPYNSYYNYIYDMGYEDGFRDGYEAKKNEDRKGIVIVRRDSFLKRIVKKIIIRNIEKRKVKDSIENGLRLKDRGRRTIENILGKQGRIVQGPEDERIFKGDFRGNAKDVFRRVKDLRIAGKERARTERPDTQDRKTLPGKPGGTANGGNSSGDVRKRIPTIPTLPVGSSKPSERKDRDDRGVTPRDGNTGWKDRSSNNERERKEPSKPTVPSFPRKEEVPKADPAKPQNGNVFDRKTGDRGNQGGQVNKPLERKTSPVDRMGSGSKPVERKTPVDRGNQGGQVKPVERKVPPSGRIGSGSKSVERKAPPSGGSSQNSDRKGGSEKKRR